MTWFALAIGLTLSHAKTSHQMAGPCGELEPDACLTEVINELRVDGVTGDIHAIVIDRSDWESGKVIWNTETNQIEMEDEDAVTVNYFWRSTCRPEELP
jgi:hypothetical protein